MSSLKDLASLIMIPSLYKDGRLDTVKPLGNSIIHPDATGNNDGTDGTTPAEGNFTFSRGSNLAATRVDVNGLIEKGRENLLLQSNQFDTTWISDRIVLTSGQTDKDGGTTAWKIAPNADNNTHRTRQVVSVSGVQTYSIYAKSAGYDWLFLYINGSYAYFNLSTGTIGNTGSIIDSEIVASTNGYYRCSITYSNSVTNAEIYVANNNGSYVFAGNGTDGIYIQDAQLEAGLVATDYIETGASTAQAGILEDMPRLDYSGGASCPALLLEPQRTNLITQSEYFADSSYIDNGVSFTLGFLSPDGNLNASKLLEDNTNSIHRFYQTSLVTASPNATISVYVKHNGRRFVLLRIADSGVGRWYDVENGILGTTFQGTPNDSTIESVGNDWYRITISHSVASQARFEFWVSDTESTSAYQGDATKGVYLYGAQLEAGSYPTSYIPTYGSSVTRSVDVSSITGASDVIGQTEGTLFAEFEIGEDNAHFFLYTNTSNAIYIQTRIGDMWRAYVINGGVYQVTITTGSVPSSGFVKMAFAYKENDFALYANGSLIGSDTSGSVPACDSYDFGLGPYGAGFGGKRTKQTALFKTRLTDAELVALTTL